MRRRQLLFGVGTAAVGVSAFVGSGAFTSIGADRAATIETAPDSEAYLRMEPNDDHPNGDYASRMADGRIRIDVNGNVDVDGKGVNPDAETVIEDVFAVQNQGTQGVGLWFTHSSTYSEQVDFTIDGRSVVGRENAYDLDQGEEVLIDIEVDTDQDADTRLMNSMTAHADADEYGS